MPTSTKPDTGAIHRVLLDSGADPKLIHPAIEEIRHLSGQKRHRRHRSSDHRTPLRDASSIHRAPRGDEYPEHGDASSIHRAPGGDEHPEQGDLAAHQFAGHSHVRPALQDPHAVSKPILAGGKRNPNGRGRLRHGGWIVHHFPTVKVFDHKPASSRSGCSVTLTVDASAPSTPLQARR